MNKGIFSTFVKCKILLKTSPDDTEWDKTARLMLAWCYEKSAFCFCNSFFQSKCACRKSIVDSIVLMETLVLGKEKRLEHISDLTTAPPLTRARLQRWKGHLHHYTRLHSSCVTCGKTRENEQLDVLTIKHIDIFIFFQEPGQRTEPSFLFLHPEPINHAMSELSRLSWKLTFFVCVATVARVECGRTRRGGG